MVAEVNYRVVTSWDAMQWILTIKMPIPHTKFETQSSSPVQSQYELCCTVYHTKQPFCTSALQDTTAAICWWQQPLIHYATKQHYLQYYTFTITVYTICRLDIGTGIVFLSEHLTLTVIKTRKFELMLTRRAKAYSSSCSQTVSLSPAISSQSILGVCTAAEDCKNQ